MKGIADIWSRILDVFDSGDPLSPETSLRRAAIVHDSQRSPVAEDYHPDAEHVIPLPIYVSHLLQTRLRTMPPLRVYTLIVHGRKTLVN